VVEDVSAVFVYLVKKQHLYADLPCPNSRLFDEAIQKTLNCGFKKQEISSLYSR
jgi:hypothetical protein